MTEEAIYLLDEFKKLPNNELLQRVTAIFSNDSNEINFDKLIQSFSSLLVINGGIMENDLNTNETFLTTLGAALYKRSARLSKFHERLLGPNSILNGYLESNHLSVKRCAVFCIRNLTMIDTTTEVYPLSVSLQSWCFNKLLSIVSMNSCYNDEYDCYKLLSGAWESLQNLLENGFKPENIIFGRLFGAVGASICFGLPGLPIVDPCTISPSSSFFQNIPNSNLVNESRKKTKRNEKRVKKHRVSKSDLCGTNRGSESSDTESQNELKNFRTQFSPNCETSTNASGIKSSDLSDSSSGLDGSRTKESFKLISMRIRLNAFHVLELSTLVCDSKTLFSFWFRFFPESNAQVFGFPSISQILMKEFSFKVRISALNSVRSWLGCCRSMLASAEIRTKPAPFTSFSETLANSLIEIHRTLNYVLYAEKYAAAIAQCTRCIATFISVAPFDKLPKNILAKTLSQCKALLVHKDASVRLGALSVYCESVKINCSDELECLFLPNSRPLLLDICSAFVRKECVLFDVHCFNSIPINIEALQTLTAMYNTHGKLLKDSTKISAQVGFECTNAPEYELQLHGLKLLNALFALDDFKLDDESQIDDLAKLLSPSTNSSTSILIETLNLYSKIVEKNISLNYERLVKSFFLNYCSHNGSIVQTTALKLLPILLQRYKNDLIFSQKCFETVLTVLEMASANVAERAGSSFVYMTRIVALNPNEDRISKIEEIKIVHESVIRALHFTQTSNVLRLKPSCMCATNLYLNHFAKNADMEVSEIILVIDLLVPIIVKYSNVEVVKLQQTALESAATIFELDESILVNIKVSQLVSVVESIDDVLRMPTVKLRNKLLAAKAISLISPKFWTIELKNILSSTLDALIASLERLDVDAYEKHVENCIKENVAYEIVHCLILILTFASSTDVEKLRFQEENVQKTLCYYFDIYKGMLFHRNEFSTNNNKEKWSVEFWKCVENLESQVNNDNKNFTLLLSYFRD